MENTMEMYEMWAIGCEELDTYEVVESEEDAISFN